MRRVWCTVKVLFFRLRRQRPEHSRLQGPTGVKERRFRCGLLPIGRLRRRAAHCQLQGRRVKRIHRSRRPIARAKHAERTLSAESRAILLGWLAEHVARATGQLELPNNNKIIGPTTLVTAEQVKS